MTTISGATPDYTAIERRIKREFADTDVEGLHRLHDLGVDREMARRTGTKVMIFGSIGGGLAAGVLGAALSRNLLVGAASAIVVGAGLALAGVKADVPQRFSQTSPELRSLEQEFGNWRTADDRARDYDGMERTIDPGEAWIGQYGGEHATVQEIVEEAFDGRPADASGDFKVGSARYVGEEFDLDGSGTISRAELAGAVVREHAQYWSDRPLGGSGGGDDLGGIGQSGIFSGGW